MAVKILIKSNNISGVAPRVDELSYAELAINTVDGHLYTKTTTNQIVNLSSWEQLHNKPGVFSPAPHAHGNLSNSGNVTDERNVGDTHKPVVVDDDGNLFFISKIDPQTVGGVISSESNVSEEIQQLHNSVSSLQEDHLNVVLTSDPRMVDAREPLPHTHSDESNNTFVGFNSLRDISTTIAFDNTCFGVDTLTQNVQGSNNVAIGKGSLFSVIESDNNTAIGLYSLISNIDSNNTAIGTAALLNNTTGRENCSLGAAALSQNTTGINNVGIGFFSGLGNTTGSNNVVIGNSSGMVGSNYNNCIVLGSFAQALTSGDLVIGSTLYPINTGASVGITGSASLLPTRPLGYLSLRLNGTLVKIPYYRE